MRMKRFRMLPLRLEAFHFASESWQGYSEEEGTHGSECPASVSGGAALGSRTSIIYYQVPMPTN